MKLALPLLLLATLSRQSFAFVVNKGVAFNPSFGSFHKKQFPRTTSFPTTTKGSTGLQMLSVDTNSLGAYFLQKVIETGVPALAFCFVVAFAAKAFRKKDDGTSTEILRGNAATLYNDLYGTGSDDNSGSSLLKRLVPTKKDPNEGINLGIPSEEYISITHLNSKLNSYQYSMTKATDSKARAAAKMRQENFDKALQLGMDSSLSSELSPHAKNKLLEIEKKFLKKGAQLVDQIQRAQAKLMETAIDREMKDAGVGPDSTDPEPNNSDNSNTTAKVLDSNNDVGDKEPKGKAWAQLGSAQRSLMQLETAFVQAVMKQLGPTRANGIRAALLGDVAARGTGGLLAQLEQRPLSSLLKHNGESFKPKSLFVMDFEGDITASQVNNLREEVTAIVRNAQPGDEALVVLETGGGTVTGYGLAAGQLQRFKEKGMKLTICVEQVAASGGYMMCCVADKIIASPFAVLGSIGVIADIPNAYERLKQEGIEFQTVTAGKYKRTITPTKKVTEEDLNKTKADLEDIFQLFKKYVSENRPSLNMEEVATGETWLGTDALDRGLCDEIKTADDVLVDYVDEGYNVYQVKYDPPRKEEEALRKLIGGQAETGDGGLFQRFVRWVVRTVASEIKSEMDGMTSSQQSLKRRYVMMDDTADKIRAQD